MKRELGIAMKIKNAPWSRESVIVTCAKKIVKKVY